MIASIGLNGDIVLAMFLPTGPQGAIPDPLLYQSRLFTFSAHDALGLSDSLFFTSFFLSLSFVRRPYLVIAAEAFLRITAWPRGMIRKEARHDQMNA